MNNAVEQYKASNLIVVADTDKVSAKGAKLSTTTVTVNKAKEVARLFGIKGDAVTLKRDEAGQALKTAITMEVGALQGNASAIGSKIKRSVLANGNISHTFTILEQKAKSASETAIAAYLGKTVEEVRAMRAAAIKSAAPAIETTPATGLISAGA